MRVFIQQYDNGRERYFTNIPVSTENKESKAFKKVYIQFWEEKDGKSVPCDGVTGNITVTNFWLSGYKFVQEQSLKNKVTGEMVKVDVKSVPIQINIKDYIKTEKDLEMDEQDRLSGKNYIKPPYNAEQIAQNKLNAYNKRASQQQESFETSDFISVPQENLDELLPF